MSATIAKQLLECEAYALKSRLDQLRSFNLQMPMVGAATVSVSAQAAIEHHMICSSRKFHNLIAEFVRWLRSNSGMEASPAQAQRRFTLLRLRFNAVLDQFDIFSSVLTQRSESECGVLLAGLDALADDAQLIPGRPYQVPPVMCFLDRGLSAAIRRVRTRLPGGAKNPVTIVRVPRERMIGVTLGSSLVHEVGHQGAASMQLVPSLRQDFEHRCRTIHQNRDELYLYSKWVSEIIADFWSVARVGITGPLGLLSVVSLPRAFVFRITQGDPHPMPWLRVKLACAMGNVLYPHAQWDKLASIWELLYPKTGLPAADLNRLNKLESVIPLVVNLVAHHKPKVLNGLSLGRFLSSRERKPQNLMAMYFHWRRRPELVESVSPTMLFAVLGQARYHGLISPKNEVMFIAANLRRWALVRSLARQGLDPPERIPCNYFSLGHEKKIERSLGK